MNLKSAVAVAALRAAGKRLGIDMSANSSVLKMAAELGYFLIQSEISDGVIAARDTTGVSDDYVNAFFKTLTDTSSVAEEATRHFYKVLADNASVSEVQVMHFYKNVADSVGLTDGIDTVDFGKGLLDVPVAIDLINRKDLTKLLTDNLWVTDDIDGAASILDDQEMQYGKITTDQSFASESLYRQVAFSRNFSDQPAAAENLDYAFGKSLSDTPSASESLYRQVDFTRAFLDNSVSVDTFTKQVAFSRAFSDSSDAADTFYRQVAFSRSFTDTSVALDSIDNVFGKALADTSSASENLDYSFGKGLSDAPSASDDVDKLETTKLLTDTVGVTDDIDGSASIQDDQEMQFTKIRTDVGNVAENFTRQVDFSRAFTDSNEISESLTQSFGKLLTNTSNVSESIALQTSVALPDDEASLTDAGSYRSQNYCDFAYFAEDYVGASGTF